MREAELMREILAAVTRDPMVRAWRHNVGVAVPLTGDARPMRYGQAGQPDIMGSVTVNGVAVALGIEVKTPTGRVAPVQLAWLRAHARLGWRCGVARSVDDALAIVAGRGAPC